MSIATALPSRPMMGVRFNEDHARRFLNYIIDPAVGCAELRIFRASIKRGNWIEADDQFPKTLGGWYDRLDLLIIDLQRVRDISAYITINPVSRDLLSRSDHKVKKIDRGNGTNDTQIVCLRWMFLDFDAERPTDISATDAERQLAIDRRDKFLADHPEIRTAAIWGTSGNGAWIFVRLPDYPNDDVHNAYVKATINSISREYSDHKVKVDPKTCNPSRVSGIPGLVKCKGSNRPERPWRFATIDSPEGHQPVPLDLPTWLGGRPDAVQVIDEPKAARVLIGPQEPKSFAQSEAINCDHNDPHTIRRITGFVSATPPAISGQGGHDQTFSVATALIKGFGLSIDEARPYLVAYNATCQPPWDESDLDHKLEDADALPDDKPRGYLLSEEVQSKTQPYSHRVVIFDLTGIVSDDFANSAGLSVEEFDVYRRLDSEGTDEEVNQWVGECYNKRKPTDPDASLETPHGLARTLLTDQFKGPLGFTLRYWRGDFHEWNGSHYQVKPRGDLTSQVNAQCEALFLADFKKKKKEFDLARQAGDGKAKPPKMRSVTRGLVADILQAMEGLTLIMSTRVPSQPAWIDCNGPWPANEILPTKGSLVHLPSLLSSQPQSTRPTPKFFSSFSLGFDYDAEAPEPTEWLKFLDQLWGNDKEAIRLLQEWFGYLLTPDTRQQKVAMIIGPKRAGKGTISRVMTALLGEENVVNPTFAGLATNFGLSPLIGKPCAIITDARLGAKTDVAVVVERLLSISGEDGQTIDRKNRDPITVKLPTRFTVLTNEIPSIKDSSGAIAGRMLILELTKTFYKQEDTGLLPRLLEELPGILRWAVAGWSSLSERGHFVEPNSSKDATQVMADLASPVAAFVRERCEIREPRATVRVPDLFNAWKTWCAEKGREHPGEEETFGRNLRAAHAGAKRRRNRVKGGGRTYAYTGIRLLTTGELSVRNNEAMSDDGDFDELPEY